MVPPPSRPALPLLPRLEYVLHLAEVRRLTPDPEFREAFRLRRDGGVRDLAATAGTVVARVGGERVALEMDGEALGARCTCGGGRRGEWCAHRAAAAIGWLAGREDWPGDGVVEEMVAFVEEAVAAAAAAVRGGAAVFRATLDLRAALEDALEDRRKWGWFAGLYASAACARAARGLPRDRMGGLYLLPASIENAKLDGLASEICGWWSYHEELAGRIPATGLSISAANRDFLGQPGYEVYRSLALRREAEVTRRRRPYAREPQRRRIARRLLAWVANQEGEFERHLELLRLDQSTAEGVQRFALELNYGRRRAEAVQALRDGLRHIRFGRGILEDLLDSWLSSEPKRGLRAAMREFRRIPGAASCLAALRFAEDCGQEAAFFRAAWVEFLAWCRAPEPPWPPHVLTEVRLALHLMQDDVAGLEEWLGGRATEDELWCNVRRLLPMSGQSISILSPLALDLGAGVAWPQARESLEGIAEIYCDEIRGSWLGQDEYDWCRDFCARHADKPELVRWLVDVLENTSRA